MEKEYADIWEALEDPPSGCADTADLYHWSTNYQCGEGPFSLYLDLIGWSQDNLGEKLGTSADLGYVEQDKLARALLEHSLNPREVGRYVDLLMELEHAE